MFQNSAFASIFPVNLNSDYFNIKKLDHHYDVVSIIK